MDEPVTLQCPWCLEPVELWIDPESAGTMVEDCAVCCRPWQLHVARDERGEVSVTIVRAQ